jgi:hypothetical protein
MNRTSIYSVEGPEEKMGQRQWEEIMVRNSKYDLKNMNTNIQAAQQIPSRNDSKRPTLRCDDQTLKDQDKT